MKLKELFTSPDKWTQGAEAKDKKGNIIPVFHPNAVSFCLMGGIHRCYNTFAEELDIINKISKHINICIMFWNDDSTRTFEDIVKLVNDLDI